MKTQEMKCDGGDHCEHEGIVRRVFVHTDDSGKPWDFNYCQNAIREDEAKGFKVVEAKAGAQPEALALPATEKTQKHSGRPADD